MHIALLRMVARSQEGMDEEVALSTAKLPRTIDALNWVDALRACVVEASADDPLMASLADKVRTSYDTLPLNSKIALLLLLIGACTTAPAIRYVTFYWRRHCC